MQCLQINDITFINTTVYVFYLYTLCLPMVTKFPPVLISTVAACLGVLKKLSVCINEAIYEKL